MEKQKKFPFIQSYPFLGRGNYQLSIINYQLSIINYQLSIIEVFLVLKLESIIDIFPIIYT
ncbi:hypothetical protein AFK68_03895 [Hydrocoleum sp. CS-953]|nr:hypothetical protein AFK68_03895 [Hydrocoleum sp. CS-953]